VLLAIASVSTFILAVIELAVGYLRTYPGGTSHGDFVDGPTIYWYGIAFAFLASCWGIGGLGLGVRTRWGWGWGLAWVGSIGAVAHGLYRLFQVPPFGISRTSAGVQAQGVWSTTILGVLIVANLLVLGWLAVQREYRAGHIL
jgi:hypothetical protein